VEVALPLLFAIEEEGNGNGGGTVLCRGVVLKVVIAIVCFPVAEVLAFLVLVGVEKESELMEGLGEGKTLVGVTAVELFFLSDFEFLILIRSLFLDLLSSAELLSPLLELAFFALLLGGEAGDGVVAWRWSFAEGDSSFFLFSVSSRCCSS